MAAKTSLSPWVQIKSKLRDAVLVKKLDLYEGFRALDGDTSGMVKQSLLEKYFTRNAITVSDEELAELRRRFGDKLQRGFLAWADLYDALEVEAPRDHVDPAHVIDKLPQPYRSINKLLGRIVDGAWAVLKHRAAQPSVDQHRATILRVGPSARLQCPSDTPPAALSVGSSGDITFVGSSTGDLLVYHTAASTLADSGDVSHRVSAATAPTCLPFVKQRLFVDIPGGITVLPAITPNPAGDTDPSTLPKLPTPDSAPPTQPEAKQEKGGKLKAGKGVAFSGGDEKDGEDESDAAAAAALAKKKKKKPPVPSWSTSASERGYLLAAAGVVGPAGLLRVFHAPPSHEHNQPWRLLAHATVPDPIASLTFSPDSRYLSVVCESGSLHIFHMHPSVIRAPDPPPVIDPDEEAMKKAAAALLGSDSEEEEAARLEKERIEAEARAPKVPVGPGVGISPLFTVPASPSVAFLSSVLHTTGLVLPQGAESGAGDAASQSGGSKAGSTRRGSSRSLGGMSGKSGKQSAQSVTKGTVPFKMSIIRPGLDGSPVTTGFAVWSSTTVAVYDLPFALVDPLDDACVIRLASDTPSVPSARLLLPHSSPITAIAPAPGSSTLAVGCAGGALCVWDAAVGLAAQVLEPLPGAVSCLQWSGTRYLIAGSSTGSVSIHDMQATPASIAEASSCSVTSPPGVPFGLIGGAFSSAAAPPTVSVESPSPRRLCALRSDGLDSVSCIRVFPRGGLVLVCGPQMFSPVEPACTHSTLSGYVYDVRSGALLGAIRPGKSAEDSSALGNWALRVLGGGQSPFGISIAGDIAVGAFVDPYRPPPVSQRLFVYTIADIIAQCLPVVGQVAAQDVQSDFTDRVVALFVGVPPSARRNEAALASVGNAPPVGLTAMTTLTSLAASSLRSGRPPAPPSSAPLLISTTLLSDCLAASPSVLAQQFVSLRVTSRDGRVDRLTKRQEESLAMLQALDK